MTVSLHSPYQTAMTVSLHSPCKIAKTVSLHSLYHIAMTVSLHSPENDIVLLFQRFQYLPNRYDGAIAQP